MHLTAFEISWNVKSLVLMLRSYSAAEFPVLRVELMLLNSLKYSAHSSNKSENEGVDHFACLQKKACFGALSVHFFD